VACAQAGRKIAGFVVTREYRYYEFAAIDQPLTEDEMAALRAVIRHAKRGGLLRRLSDAGLWQP